MNNSALILLYLEDNPRDAELVRNKLQQAGVACELMIVSGRAEYEAALARTRFDLILSDYKLPGYDGMATLALARAKQPDVPFIMISGELGEEQAVDCVLRGANDFVLKQRPVRLVPAVLRALAEAEEHQKRRQAEESLRTQNKTFSQVLNGLDAIVYVVDMKTYEIVFINAYGQNIWGDIKGKICWQTIQAGKAGPCEFCTNSQLIGPDGKPTEGVNWEFHNTINKRWYDCRDKAIYWPDGRIVRMEIATDITERKRASVALQESEEKYRNLFESSHDAIMTIEPPSWGFTSGNQSAVQMFGAKTEAEFISYGPGDLSPERQPDGRASAEKAKEMIETAVREGSHSFEWTHKRISGDEFSALVLLSKVKQDEKVFLQATVRDITEHKQAEEALWNSETRYRALFEHSADGILIVDTETKSFTYANPAICRMLGYTLDELITLGVSDIHPKDDLPQVAAEFEAQVRGKKMFTTAIPCLRKDGTIFNADVNAAIATIDNRPCLVGFFRDITERKAIENQLHQAQKMESVGHLAGGVAHDFNNILQIIMGNVEMALAQAKPDNPLRPDLEEVRSAGRRGADLTRQLLAFARKQTIEPRTLDLNDTVESILKMLRRLVGENIELGWTPRAGLWPVKMDPSQVDQILANLCVNARDAIAGGGAVHIATENVRVDELQAVRHEEFLPGDYVMLTVSDTGCGMDKKTQARIFEPFFTTKEVGKGTGLGLATVYGIVQQNKGHIGVYSEPGKGTTFRIHLPRHMGAEAAHLAEGLAQPVFRGCETVLLVEDDVAILNLSDRMLHSLGYTVLAAGTPEAALRMADEHAGDIQLLVTDVVMPGMNVRELAEKLQARHPNLKRLYMSGFTADVIAHQGVLDKGIRFIQKPFSMADLAAKVREVLAGA